MNSYDYCTLGTGDVPLFRGLLKMFGEAFEDLPTYQDAVPDNAYVEWLLSRPHFIALAATHEDEVVGGIAAYVLDKFERKRREIYIYDLAVAAAHRRRGIATALIRRLIDIAQERCAYVIFVQADRGDEPAIRLYEWLGTREDVLHFDIPIRATR